MYIFNVIVSKDGESTPFTALRKTSAGDKEHDAVDIEISLEESRPSKEKVYLFVLLIYSNVITYTIF